MAKSHQKTISLWLGAKVSIGLMISLPFLLQPEADADEMKDIATLELVTAQHNFSLWAALGRGTIDISDFGRYINRQLTFNATTYRLEYSFNLPLGRSVNGALGTMVGVTNYAQLPIGVLKPRAYLMPGITAGIHFLINTRHRFLMGLSYQIERWENFGYEKDYSGVATPSAEEGNDQVNEASFSMQVLELRFAFETYWNEFYGLRLISHYSSSRIARPFGADSSLLNADIVNTSYWFGLGLKLRFF